MAGSKSDYLEGIVLNLVLGAVAYTAPVTLYIALSTAAYSDAATGAAMTEVTGSGYARLAVTNNTTNWPNATGTSPTTKSNGTAFTFAAASGSWSSGSPITAFYIVDSVSGAGNVLYGGDLTASKVIASGDTATFAAGAITVTED